MDFSDSERAFLETAHIAAMTTLSTDGRPHTVRVGVALVDGKLWSSGIPNRVRTGNLRRDPRSTVIVFDKGYGYLTIEARARIIEGPEAVDPSVRLFQIMQGRDNSSTLRWNGKEIPLDEFKQVMRDEHRLIYEFDPQKTYGMS